MGWVQGWRGSVMPDIPRAAAGGQHCVCAPPRCALMLHVGELRAPRRCEVLSAAAAVSCRLCTEEKPIAFAESLALRLHGAPPADRGSCWAATLQCGPALSNRGRGVNGRCVQGAAGPELHGAVHRCSQQHGRLSSCRKSVLTALRAVVSELRLLPLLLPPPSAVLSLWPHRCSSVPHCGSPSSGPAVGEPNRAQF